MAVHTLSPSDRATTTWCWPVIRRRSRMSSIRHPSALDQDIKILLAGEAITESWRDHVLNRIGHPGDPGRVCLIYGTAEAGVMGHETALTTDIRRRAATDAVLSLELFGATRLGSRHSSGMTRSGGTPRSMTTVSAVHPRFVDPDDPLPHQRSGCGVLGRGPAKHREWLRPWGSG